MDLDIVLRFLIALVFVLGLIGLLSWAARRFGLAGRVPIRKGRQRRTMVVEATAIDAKRRLVLVRRDKVEHLILLGPVGDVVVEQGISAPTDAAQGGSTDDGPPVGDFGSELKARSAVDGRSALPPATDRSATASGSEPAKPIAPQPARPAIARRSIKSKLATLKPVRDRLPKSPQPKP